MNSQELFQDGNYHGHELENMLEQHLNSDNIKAICKLVVYIFFNYRIDVNIIIYELIHISCCYTAEILPIPCKTLFNQSLKLSAEERVVWLNVQNTKS